MRSLKKLMLLVVGSVCLALSQSLPKDIMGVLERVDKANASYKTAKASIEMVMKMGQMSNSLKGELWMDNQAGKFRMHLGSGEMETLLIYDGENLWNYSVADKTYVKQKFTREDIEKGLFMLMPPALAVSPTCKKSFTSEDFLKTLGGSSLKSATLNKKSVHLITFVDKTDKSQIKLAVDPKDYRILQIALVMPPQANGEVTFKILNIQANVSFPEDAFTFNPPSDAKEYTPQRPETMEGQTAPDFTLKAIDGTEYTLSALRGKVVLIDFWATWCPPCREELPMIEQLHKEYKDKGLVVLGINDEDKATVSQFVKENKLTFPTLMDEGMNVARAYKVVAIPRVILINKEGKIVKDITGYSKENEKILREAIEQSLKE